MVIAKMGLVATVRLALIRAVAWAVVVTAPGLVPAMGAGTTWAVARVTGGAILPTAMRHVWAIPLSARSAMPLSTRKWPSKSWQRRPMAKRLCNC